MRAGQWAAPASVAFSAILTVFTLQLSPPRSIGDRGPRRPRGACLAGTGAPPSVSRPLTLTTAHTPRPAQVRSSGESTRAPHPSLLTAPPPLRAPEDEGASCPPSAAPISSVIPRYGLRTSMQPPSSSHAATACVSPSFAASQTLVGGPSPAGLESTKVAAGFFRIRAFTILNLRSICGLMLIV